MANKNRGLADYVELNIDPATLPVITRSYADWSISEHNAQRADELRVNGFSELRPQFIMEHSKGTFVAAVIHASGGGRVSAVNDGKDYCNLRVEYALFYRIED